MGRCFVLEVELSVALKQSGPFDQKLVLAVASVRSAFDQFDPVLIWVSDKAKQ